MSSALSVSYSRLRSLGNFENEKLGITVLIEPGESANDALDRAKQWVEQNLGVIGETRDEIDQLYRQKRDLAEKIRLNQEELEALHGRRQRAVELLKSHGVNTEQLEEIPF